MLKMEYSSSSYNLHMNLDKTILLVQVEEVEAQFRLLLTVLMEMAYSQLKEVLGQAMEGEVELEESSLYII